MFSLIEQQKFEAEFLRETGQVYRPIGGGSQLSYTNLVNGDRPQASGWNSRFLLAINLLNNGIEADNIASGAVTTAKINDDAVTLAKMAHGTQGGIIYYAASGVPTELAAGTSGYFLKSQGAGANPTWDAISMTTSGLPVGTVLQVQMSQDSAVDSSTTALPVDNTTPQNTEGEEYSALSVTITPNATTNILVFDVQLNLQHSAGNQIGIGIFQDSTANAVFAGYINDAVSFQPGQGHLQFKMTAGTTSATTFKVRYGPASASGTVYANADSTGTQRFNGKLFSSMKITEIKAS